MIIAAGDDEVNFDHDAVKITAGDSCSVLTDGGIKFRMNFYVDEDVVEALEDADSYRVFAVITNYTTGMNIASGSGIAVDLVRGDCLGTNGDYYYEYTLLFGGFTAEDAEKPIGVRGFISYTVDGVEYTVASEFRSDRDVIIPFEHIYDAYCNGTYERGTDTNSLRIFLASNLSVKIKDGKAYDELESDKYESVYNIEYFDGVLTISLRGGDIPDWLISCLKINGNERYFEIYEGKIRLVV